MRHFTSPAAAAVAALLAGFVFTVRATEESGRADKTLSPFFFVKSDDQTVDQMPLKATSAAVDISGVIADIKVTQLYKNQGQKTLEAVYIFPGSTRAAVHGMRMTIGERVIVATIRGREQARQEYEQARREGRSASLLEQQRPNVFQMNVANILPGDEIKVELSYTELLTPDDGVYEFIYPTVVGPRYSNKPEAGAPASEAWVKSPYLRQSEPPPATFDIAVRIDAGTPLRDIACPSHKTAATFEDPRRASVRLDPAERAGGNRDFILKYRLNGGAIETGMLLYKGHTENFFLLTMQPPRKVAPAQIPPREYIFVVDVSGSMHGFPLDISKKLLRDLIGGLRATDTFNVVLFSGGSTVMAERSLPATRDNIAKAIQVIDHQTGGGGTELLPALRTALSLPGAERVSRSIVIATDGFVSVEKEAFDLIRGNLGNANMFAFGIGSSVNRHLIEGMARVGMGEPFVITKPDEAPAQAAKFREYIQSPALTRATVDFGGFEAYDVEPPGIPDLLANRPIILFGKWRGAPTGTITLSGLSGDRPHTDRLDVAQSAPSDSHRALRHLWARHKIALLSDYNMLAPDDARVKEVTNPGLTYNLLTDYTSFVAVDSLTRATPGGSATVQQPLPLPQGVSDLAVGGCLPMAECAAMPMPRGCKSSAALPSAKLEKEMCDAAAVPEKAKGEKERQPGGTIRHQPEKLTVTGALSKESVERVVTAGLRGLEDCLRRALRAHPSLTGTVSVRILLDGTGNVTSVEWSSSDPSAEQFKTDAVTLVKGWKFDAPKDGKPATITCAFSIKGLSGN